MIVGAVVGATVVQSSTILVGRSGSLRDESVQESRRIER